jgi:hypothetical protein
MRQALSVDKLKTILASQHDGPINRATTFLNRKAEWIFLSLPRFYSGQAQFSSTKGERIIMSYAVDYNFLVRQTVALWANLVSRPRVKLTHLPRIDF